MASDLPVIHLSLFADKENISGPEGSNELKKLREACEEFGFFHVVNHGVDKDLIEKMECASRDMFSLPEEVKRSAMYSIPVTGYYPPTLGPDGKDSMPESMHFPGDSVLPNSIDQVSTKLWPHGNPHFRKSEEEPQNSHRTTIGHTDLSFLTILWQDEVGGLQLRTKEQSWINVKPLKGSFVVNLGDCL